MSSSILAKAEEIVTGDREKTYGSPRKNLDTIAAYWTAHLKARNILTPLSSLTFEDVALMMAALKLARLANDPTHEDSLVDACGYLRLLDRCQQNLKDSDPSRFTESTPRPPNFGRIA